MNVLLIRIDTIVLPYAGDVKIRRELLVTLDAQALRAEPDRLHGFTVQCR